MDQALAVWNGWRCPVAVHEPAEYSLLPGASQKAGHVSDRLGRLGGLASYWLWAAWRPPGVSQRTGYGPPEDWVRTVWNGWRLSLQAVYEPAWSQSEDRLGRLAGDSLQTVWRPPGAGQSEYRLRTAWDG